MITYEIKDINSDVNSENSNYYIEELYINDKKVSELNKEELINHCNIILNRIEESESFILRSILKELIINDWEFDGEKLVVED